MNKLDIESKHKLAEFLGAWSGDDLEEVMETVKESRSDISESINKLDELAGCHDEHKST